MTISYLFCNFSDSVADENGGGVKEGGRTGILAARCTILAHCPWQSLSKFISFKNAPPNCPGPLQVGWESQSLSEFLETQLQYFKSKYSFDQCLVGI